MKWRMLAVLSVAEMLGMAVWFSATAVVPALTADWQLHTTEATWLTMAVQVGFVAGTLVSAVFNISDIISARRLFVASAFLAAFCNGLIPLAVDTIEPALVLRFCTGVCLAGVYPPGMKIIASWFREDRGMAIGTLVGALTIGSASPHVLKIFGGSDWRMMMLLASGLAVLAGLLCLFFVQDGPWHSKKARFDWRYVGRAFQNKSVRLANFGYLGHMWELYAMWTWISVFLLASFTQFGLANATFWTAIGTFLTIAVGGVGSVLAGILADKYGRPIVTMAAMLVSGVCCCVIGLLFGVHPIGVMVVCLIWGVAIVADSAQFSTAVTELSEPEYLGTALTLQTCLGFLLTLGSIRLLPLMVEWVSWRWAFTVLAIGPLLGIIAMARLRRLPEAMKIGGVHQQ